MNGYFTFFKAPGLEAHHQKVLFHIQDKRFGASYSPPKVYSVYSTAPAECTYICECMCCAFLSLLIYLCILIYRHNIS